MMSTRIHNGTLQIRVDKLCLQMTFGKDKKMTAISL
jgi:hypothetical protein